MSRRLIREITRQLKANVYCSTGEGGGKDPSCGREGGSKDKLVEVYHGTRDTLLKKIAKGGLIASDPSTKTRKWIKGGAGLKEQPKGVYHAKTLEDAIKWATIAADTLGKAKTPVIVVARVPKSWVKKDPIVKGAYYVDRNIPPSMLVKSMTVEWAPGKEGDPDRWKGKWSAVDERPFIRNAEREQTEDVYVVVLTDGEEPSKTEFIPLTSEERQS